MKSLGLLIIRIITGGTLLAHGYTKLFGGEGKKAPKMMNKLYGKNFPPAVESGGPAAFAKGLEHMQVPYPQAGAYLSGVAEFGGGLALLSGAFTRPAALLVIANMLTAIRQAHWETGFYGQGGFEFPAQLLSGALALLLAGPGAFSFDWLLGRD